MEPARPRRPVSCMVFFLFFLQSGSEAFICLFFLSVFFHRSSCLEPLLVSDADKLARGASNQPSLRVDEASDTRSAPRQIKRVALDNRAFFRLFAISPALQTEDPACSDQRATPVLNPPSHPRSRSRSRSPPPPPQPKKKNFRPFSSSSTSSSSSARSPSPPSTPSCPGDASTPPTPR